MGRNLIEQSPLFRQSLERCDDILQSLPDSPDWSCVDELLKSADDSRLSQSCFSQPVCAALQLAIVDLLKAWGITPSALVGHSSGEIVAAYSAGILSFENSIICAYYRGLYMSKGASISGRGAMMAVGLTENEGIEELKAYQNRISMAAINSPSSLTFSGDEDAILELKQSLDKRKIFARQLQVEQAFHSHHMKPLAPAFEKALSKNGWSLLGRDMTGVVRFSDALTGILLDDQDEQNIDVIVEIGAHPALRGPSKQVMKTLKLDIPYIPSLTRDDLAYESLLATAGQLFALGYPVDLAAANSNHFITGNEKVSRMTPGKQIKNLPTYAWNHSKFWAETQVIRKQRLRKFRHTVLGAPVPGSQGNYPQWRTCLRQTEIPWLSQHVIDGNVIFPAAGFICIAIEAITTLSSGFKSILLRDVMFKSALKISASEVGTEVMLDLEPLAASSKSFSSTWYKFGICSFDENYRTIEHCHGQISLQQGAPSAIRNLDTTESFVHLQKGTNTTVPQTAYYKQFSQFGILYGKNFQLLSGDVESDPEFAVAPLTFHPSAVSSTPADDCVLHPTVLDSSFHVVFAAIETQLGRPPNEGFVPTFIHSMAVSGLLDKRKHTSNEQRFWVKSDTKLPDSRTAISHLSIMSEFSNDVLVDLKGLEVTALGNNLAVEGAERTLFFRIRWPEAFDRLGTNATPLPFNSIADVMDLFTHQFPNSNILHFASNPISTKEVLRYIGGRQGERRRFQSITPCYRSSLLLLESAKALESEWPSLVKVEEPRNDSYDLIVISEPIDYDVLSFLKADDFVIKDNTTSEIDDSSFDHLGMFQVFKSKNFSSWRKSDTTIRNFSEEGLTLVLSSSPSDAVKALASMIQSPYTGTTTTVIITELLDNQPLTPNIISLVSLDEDPFLDVPDSNPDRYLAVQRLLASVSKNIIWLLRGASCETSYPAQALMLGLIRTARNENEKTRFVTLDLSPDSDNFRSSQAAIELLDRSFAEDEVAERQCSLRIPRLEAHDELNRKLPNSSNRQVRFEPFHQSRKLALKIEKVGLLDTLMFEDDEDVLTAGLDDDYIEIQVKASALNFRDIAASIGIIDDYRLGDECAGVVTRVGRNVKELDFRPGDRVLAIRPGKGAHRSIVQNPAILCHKIEGMDFATATSIMGVFTTAYFSLIDTARLKSGEYCLIHAAAGGVGQMAVQLAQMLGANVIATVGSQSKRDFIKEKFGLSDEMIFNSRDSSLSTA